MSSEELGHFNKQVDPDVETTTLDILANNFKQSIQSSNKPSSATGLKTQNQTLQRTVAILNSELQIVKTKLTQTELQHKEYIKVLETKAQLQSSRNLSLIQELNRILQIPISSTVQHMIEKVKELVKLDEIKELYSKMRLEEMNSEVVKLRTAYQKYRQDNNNLRIKANVEPTLTNFGSTEQPAQQQTNISTATLKKKPVMEVYPTVNTYVHSVPPIIAPILSTSTEHPPPHSFQDFKRQYQAQILELKKAKNQLQHELVKSQSKQAAISKRYKQNEQKLTKLEVDILEITNKLSAYETVNSELKQRLNSSQKPKQTNNNNNKILEEEMQKLKEQIAKVKKEYDTKAETLKAQYESKLQNKDHDIDKLNVRHQDALTNSLNHHRQVVQQLEAKHKQAIEQQRRNFEIETDRLLKENSAKIQKTVEQHKQQMMEMAEQLNKFVKEQSGNIDRMNAEFTRKSMETEQKYMAEIEMLKDALQHKQEVPRSDEANLRELIEEQIQKIKIEADMEIDKMVEQHQQNQQALQKQLHDTQALLEQTRQAAVNREAELNNDIEKYSKELAHVQGHLEQTMRKIEALQKIQKKDQQNSGTTEAGRSEQQLYELRIKLEQAISQRKTVSGNFQRLREQLQISQEECKNERSKFEACLQRVTELEYEINRIQAESKDSINQLENRCREIMESSRIQKQQLLAQNFEAATPNTSSQKSEAVGRDIESLSNTISELTQKLTEQQQKLDETLQEKSALEKSTAILRQKQSQQAIFVSSLQKQKQSLENQVSQLRKQVSDLSDQQIQINQNSLNSKNTITSLTEEITELQRKVRNSEADIQRLKSLVTSLNNDLSAKEEALAKLANANTQQESSGASKQQFNLSAQETQIVEELRQEISKLKASQSQLRKQNLKINRLKHSLLEDMCKEIIIEILPTSDSVTSVPVPKPVAQQPPVATGSLLPQVTTKSKVTKPKAKKVLNFDIGLEQN